MTVEEQAEYLRAAFGKINGIDPCGPTYPKIVALLDGLGQEELRFIAAQNIKFISSLARNRVKPAS